MQHEAAIDLHRAAEMHRAFAQPGVVERDVDLLEQRGQRHVGRLVDDDAERAVLVVLADVGERVRKMRIRHRRHGDQEVMREIGGRGHGVTHGCNCKRRSPLGTIGAPANRHLTSVLLLSAPSTLRRLRRVCICLALLLPALAACAPPAQAGLVLMHGPAELTSATL